VLPPIDLAQYLIGTQSLRRSPPLYGELDVVNTSLQTGPRTARRPTRNATVGQGEGEFGGLRKARSAVAESSAEWMLWARCCPCACAARNTSAKATKAQKQANTTAGALHQEAAAQALACTLHAQAPAKKREKPPGSPALLARPAANGEAAAVPAPVARKERSGMDDYILVRSDALAAESGCL